MATHGGPVRLPPIGALGLKKLSLQEGRLEEAAEKSTLIDDKTIHDLESQEKTKKGSIGCFSQTLPSKTTANMDGARKTDLIDSGLESPGDQKESFGHGMPLEMKQPNEQGFIRNGKKGRTDRRKKNDLHSKLEGRKDHSYNVASGDYNFVEQKTEPDMILPVDSKTDDFKRIDLDAHITSHHISSTLTEDTILTETENFHNFPSNNINQRSAYQGIESRTDFRELAIRLANNYSRPKISSKKRNSVIDYVLVFDIDDESELNEGQRENFEKYLIAEGIEVTRTHIGNHIYVELFCSFKRLCQEAEALFLEMPLIGLSQHKSDKESSSWWRAFESEKEVDDICIPFCNATKEIYDGFNDEENFFRPGVRSLLVNQILKSINIDESESKEQRNVEALASLIHLDVYTDAFILHERSSLDPRFPLIPNIPDKGDHYPAGNCSRVTMDRRKDLHATWVSNFKFQPLWKIRNYFGEKIALYFAWLGMLITSLWIPTFIGVAVFIYGIIVAFINKKESTWSRVAFDNDLTPAFALIICLWGTVFLEIWKRKNAELAYKWDVDDFEQQEPNRPQFYGSEMQLNPITGLYEPFYSPLKKTLKSMGSMTLILLMVLFVVASLVSVIIYRIIARVDWFTGRNSVLLSNTTSSVLNSTSIMLLGYVYKALAKKLTEWENHRTQTQFEDSLILKLFGFQFVNSYSSLYYIAFFRERTKDGILGRGTQYTDSCGTSNDCMSLLSLQVGILMLMKPMPKFCTDVLAPLLLKTFKSFIRKMKRNRVLDEGSFVNEQVPADVEFEDYIQHERKKPAVKDFTLSEYTEKVIQYGYLMLFAAACPLAPLIALVTNLIDLKIDARRLLWLNRRPIPLRAQDIGMWFTILQLLNYIGVITNAFIIAITSSFGRKYETTTIYDVVVSNITLSNNTNIITTDKKTVNTLEYLWIIILFQNISFVVKFILEYSISDEPEKVTLARRKERYLIEEVLKKAGYRRGRGKSIVPMVERSVRNPDGEEQMLIENRIRGGKEAFKEKIRRISVRKTKSRRTNNDKENKKDTGKKNQFFVNDERNKFGESEV